VKRWLLEHHYLPTYELNVKANEVQDGYKLEPGAYGPHPLYDLIISFLRQHPRILRDSATAALPESVLQEVMSKPLGCITRVLEVLCSLAPVESLLLFSQALCLCCTDSRGSEGGEECEALVSN
jgi:hypothetical protein